jgi:CubicO group peptidase (beta-lactamase class C family)
VSSSKGWFLALLSACLFASPLAAPPGWQAFGFQQNDSATSRQNEDEILARDYPSLRALVVARGECVVTEYYRADVSMETRSPVHSVTKSLLSIVVGIAVDAGYLRLEPALAARIAFGH